MALNWMDFSWTIKRWLQLYPLSFVTSLPSSTPASGNYAVTTSDYALTSTNASNATWTLFTPVGNDSHVLKIKNRGAGELTLSGSIFTDQVVTTLVLVTGDMVTLRSDGTYWNVGD